MSSRLDHFLSRAREDTMSSDQLEEYISNMKKELTDLLEKKDGYNDEWVENMRFYFEDVKLKRLETKLIIKQVREALQDE